MRLVLAMYVVSAECFGWQARCARMEPQNAGTQASSPPQTAWRRVTCGSSDDGLPALRDEPILGSGQMNFIEQWHPSSILRIRGAAQSDAGRGTRAIPGVHSFPQA